MIIMTRANAWRICSQISYTYKNITLTKLQNRCENNDDKVLKAFYPPRSSTRYANFIPRSSTLQS